MDYIREFDIRLEKEMYYAGETLSGVVMLDTSENFKVKAIRALLRGKAHTEWKVMVSGDRRTVKDDQYFIDDRSIIWGKEKAEGNVPILPRGVHQFPFKFQLPESSLPCSFESRAGTIRYYLKVTVDIPYASPPQGMKYFTIIGPHIDVMDYLRPTRGETKRRRCCLCCESGKVSLRTDFERSAYVCGESLRVKADIDNQSEEEVRLKLRLVQYIEYYIDRGVLGVEKEGSNTILEYRGAPVSPHSRTKWDSQQNLVLPTIPPTLVGVCRLIQIYYVLKVNVELEKSGEDLHMHFPITIATVPFRIPNSSQMPVITYEVACDHSEGGMYIGPEFLLGQVYDGTSEFGESIVLYRPVYPTVKSGKGGGSMPNNTANVNNSIQSQPQSSASTPNASKGLKVDVPKDLSLILNQIQPQLPQTQPKPGTSSAVVAATNNKSSTPLTNSNLISATPATTTTPTIIPAASEGGDLSNPSKVVESRGQSTNNPLGKDPSSSSSHSSSMILPTVHKTRVPGGESSKILEKSEGISSEANNSVSVTSTDGDKSRIRPSGSSGPKRTKKLSASGSSGGHVSFDAESASITIGESGVSGGHSSKSMSKKSKTPSTSSSGSRKGVPQSGSGDFSRQVKSAAVDIAVSKIEKDETIAKSGEYTRGTVTVFPGKVVKLETPSVPDGKRETTTGTES